MELLTLFFLFFFQKKKDRRKFLPRSLENLFFVWLTLPFSFFFYKSKTNMQRASSHAYMLATCMSSQWAIHSQCLWSQPSKILFFIFKKVQKSSNDSLGNFKIYRFCILFFLEYQNFNAYKSLKDISIQ